MSSPRLRRQAGLCGVAAALALAGGLTVAAAGTNERIVADRTSGVALWGYDPVAYFLDEAARQGRSEHEASHAGVTWRFVNAGNLAAFIEAPDTYMPAFGGFDPTAAARGNAVPGNPEVFAHFRGRVYLFRDEASRERFFSDPGTTAKSAETGWPEAVRTVPR